MKNITFEMTVRDDMYCMVLSTLEELISKAVVYTEECKINIKELINNG